MKHIPNNRTQERYDVLARAKEIWARNPTAPFKLEFPDDLTVIKNEKTNLFGKVKNTYYTIIDKRYPENMWTLL